MFVVPNRWIVVYIYVYWSFRRSRVVRLQCDFTSRVSDTPPMTNIKTQSHTSQSEVLNQLDESEQNEHWPARVHREMNVNIWESELKRWNLLDKHGHLLEGFKEGFHQGIPEHTISNLNWFCPPNHTSALQVRAKIEANLLKEVKAGRMFGPFEKQEVFDNLGFF